MLENEETTTLNISVLDFKGAVSVEWNGDCPDENREQVFLYLEKSAVVGPWQEEQYQGALVMVYLEKVTKQRIGIQSRT
mgnify:CR=1 FL=1